MKKTIIISILLTCFSCKTEPHGDRYFLKCIPGNGDSIKTRTFVSDNPIVYDRQARAWLIDEDIVTTDGFLCSTYFEPGNLPKPEKQSIK